MTTDNTLIGPDEPGDVDWKALEHEVFGDVVVEAAPAAPVASVPAAPVAPAAPEPDEDADAWSAMDQNADEYLWPSVLDEKGKLTGETARPNPEAMRTALRRAEATSAADVDVLAEAISEPEVREIIHAAAEQRGFERGLDATLAKRRAELASEGARRQAEHDHRMAESRRRRENRAAAARERRDRALDPTSKIVRLAAAERWVPWIAITPAVLAAVLGAVNVGVSLDHLSPGTGLINWMVEPLVTIPLIAILVAQILGAIGEGRANPYRRLEQVLVAIAVGLNVGLHVYIDGKITPASLVWLIVPAGLAISANLVPRLIRSLREALAAASDESIREQIGEQNRGPLRTAPAARSTAAAPGPQAEAAWTAPGPSQVSEGAAAGSSVERSRSETDLFVELAAAVRESRIDPGTGRAIDPTVVESIRRTLGVRKDRARALRDAWAAAAD